MPRRQHAAAQRLGALRVAPQALARGHRQAVRGVLGHFDFKDYFNSIYNIAQVCDCKRDWSCVLCPLQGMKKISKFIFSFFRFGVEVKTRR